MFEDFSPWYHLGLSTMTKVGLLFTQLPFVGVWSMRVRKRDLFWGPPLHPLVLSSNGAPQGHCQNTKYPSQSATLPNPKITRRLENFVWTTLQDGSEKCLTEKLLVTSILKCWCVVYLCIKKMPIFQKEGDALALLSSTKGSCQTGHWSPKFTFPIYGEERVYPVCCSDINLSAILCGFSKSINTIRMAAWLGGLQGYRDWEGWRQSIGRGDTLPLQCTSQCTRQNQHEASFVMIFLCV